MTSTEASQAQQDEPMEGASSKNIRGIKRLLTELPQPARTFYWCSYAMFLATFVIGAATRMNSAVR